MEAYRRHHNTNKRKKSQESTHSYQYLLYHVWGKYSRFMTRLANYIEDKNLVPYTMLDFRTGLSTQNAFLIPSEEALLNITKGSEHIILALDLKGAFYHVSHRATLEALNESQCWKKDFQLCRNFFIRPHSIRLLRNAAQGNSASGFYCPPCFQITDHDTKETPRSHKRGGTAGQRSRPTVRTRKI